MANALLYMAICEGLLDDDPTIGDGFVRKLLSNHPPEQVVSDALEQLILGGKVFVPFWLPSRWNGELLERQTVVPIESPAESEFIEVPQMPADLVLGMLRSRDAHWSHAELADRYQAFRKAYSDWEAISAGKSYDGLEIRMALRGIWPIEEKDYTAEQISAWQTVQEEYRQLRPVMDCVEAYRRVITTSIQFSALSALPVIGPHSLSLETPSASEGLERRALLRVTCKALRRVPIGNTLRETIHLAASPEAQGLRIKLTSWTERLRQGEFEPAAIILPEVEKARKSLATAKTLFRVGEYSTWVGVPVAIAGAFLTGPVGIGIGVTVSVIGGLALTGQKVIERFNQWAMYAQE
jgi:hypothetical protein